MLRHYFAVKAEHPEAVLLYRVGDFYECYSDDAVLVSKVLGLPITQIDSSYRLIEWKDGLQGVPMVAKNVTVQGCHRGTPLNPLCPSRVKGAVQTMN